MDLLKRNAPALYQLIGVLVLSLGVALYSIAAGLAVLGSLILAYGIIREVVATTATESPETEEPQDDGVR